jgi:hypothetical protein
MKTLQILLTKKTLLIFLTFCLLSCTSKKNEKKTTYEQPIKSVDEKKRENPVKNSFNATLEKSLQKRNQTLQQLCDENDSVSKRILLEYGAMFVATDDVLLPNTCIFTNSTEVESFQAKTQITTQEIGGAKIELQANAMKNYLAARDEAQKSGLDIRPRGGNEASRRGFDDTFRLWKSRVDPACDHWFTKGRLSDEQIKQLKSMGIKEQIKEVLSLEENGIFFNTFFNRTILSSVAAPGTSQHLSMLALDIEEFKDENVRKIMRNNGWFRTVQNDAPHFTFLGRLEEELEALGLKKIDTKDGEYWVPNI